jgi:[ribosomal protein S5]-alanine N-acetyltransferase
MQPSLQSFQKIFPIIDLGDFILREKCDADVEDFFSYYSDPEVNKFILCEIPTNVEEARRELQYWRGIFYHNDGIYFAIAEKKTNRLIGSIGLTTHNSYQNRIELSYDLSSQYWRRGITSVAINAVLNYGFQNLKVNRIEAFVSVENIPSKNLLLKNGFTLEGLLRQHRYHRGRYVDVYVFSMLRSEFMQDHT